MKSPISSDNEDIRCMAHPNGGVFGQKSTFFFICIATSFKYKMFYFFKYKIFQMDESRHVLQCWYILFGSRVSNIMSKASYTPSI